MIDYKDLYIEFLSDMDDNDVPNVEVEPASFSQISFIRSLLEGNAMNAIPDFEARQIEYWLSGDMTYADASRLIDRILQAQPDEPPIHSQKLLAKWLREKKLYD